MPFPVAIALSLAKLALPPLARFLTGDEKAEKVAETVVQVAQQVTGVQDPEEALKQLQEDRALLSQYQMRLLEHEEFKTRLEAEQWEKEFQGHMANVADARDRDIEVRKVSAGRNVRADLLAYGAVGIFAGIIWRMLSAPLPHGVDANLLFFIIGQFMGIVVTIYSFEFGSSQGSVRNGAMVRDSLERVLEKVK